MEAEKFFYPTAGRNGHRPGHIGREKKAQKKHTSITTDVNTKQYKRSDSIYTATTAKYDRRGKTRPRHTEREKGKKATFLKEKRKGEKGT